MQPPFWQSRSLAYLALLISMFTWGSSFIAMKIALQSWHPLLITFMRMVISLVIFILLIKFYRKPQYQKGDLKLIVLLVLLEPCLFYLFESYAMVFTTASQAAVVVSLMPLMVGLMAMRLLQEPFQPRLWVASLLGVGGVVAISLTSGASAYAPAPLLGNGLEFMAMLCGAMYTILVRKLVPRYGALWLTALQMLAGSLFFSLFLWLPDNQWPVEWEINVVLAVVWLGAVVNVVAYGMFNFSLSRLPATVVSPFINLIPVVAILLAYLLLNETMQPLQWGGVALVVLGVMLGWRSGSVGEAQQA